MEVKNSPLIVIVGPTASGKTATAIEIARQIGGEIICADSRTIYKGMDIGTAKPTSEERAAVPHWGLDVVEPGGRFTAADFKEYATKKITDIRARGRIPFLVGGTGLYVDAVIFDYQFGADRDPSIRQKLEMLNAIELIEYCKKSDILLPSNTQNKRHLVRAIEQKGINQQRRSTPISTSIIVGIATESLSLKAKIAMRSEQILTNGVVDEAIELGKKYGWESEAMTGNIYRLIPPYLKKQRTIDELASDFMAADWQLARRQMTWFRRNPHIVWTTRDEAARHVHTALVS